MTGKLLPRFDPQPQLCLTGLLIAAQTCMYSVLCLHCKTTPLHATRSVHALQTKQPLSLLHVPEMAGAVAELLCTAKADWHACCAD